MGRKSSVFIFCGALLVTFVGFARGGAEEGRKVFDAKKCMTCHSLGGEKGTVAQLGGPLDGVGAKHDAAWFKAYLPDPKSQKPDAKMPKQTLTEQELEDLVRYLLTLQ